MAVFVAIPLLIISFKFLLTTSVVVPSAEAISEIDPDGL
jgi:hypothetical protein